MVNKTTCRNFKSYYNFFLPSETLKCIDFVLEYGYEMCLLLRWERHIQCSVGHVFPLYRCVGWLPEDFEK